METPLDRIDQVDAMRLGVSYRHTIKVRNFSMQVRPLSIAETLEVASNVVEKMRTLSETQQNRLSEHTLLAQETLIKASTAAYGKTDIKITEQVIQAMTPDELTFLWKQYMSVIDKVNPCLELLTKEKAEEMVEALKKSPPSELGLALTEHSFSDLASMVQYFLTKGE